MTSADPARKPSVLFVYYTYTQQTLKVVEAMASVLRDRGCDVNLAAIELTDPRYQKRFSQFPMPKPFLEVVATIPAELRRRPAQIGIPGVVTERDCDLVCVGAPTWWLSTDVPIRSFLESDTATRLLEGKPFAAAVCCRRYWKHNLKTVRRLGTKQGGVFADGIHFRYQGGQVRSLLSLLSYLGSGEYRPRYLGVKIPPTNLQDQHLVAARTFADGLANRLLDSPVTRKDPGLRAAAGEMVRMTTAEQPLNAPFFRLAFLAVYPCLSPGRPLARVRDTVRRAPFTPLRGCPFPSGEMGIHGMVSKRSG